MTPKRTRSQRLADDQAVRASMVRASCHITFDDMVHPSDQFKDGLRALLAEWYGEDSPHISVRWDSTIVSRPLHPHALAAPAEPIPAGGRRSPRTRTKPLDPA
jgi:hypothetical protein